MFRYIVFTIAFTIVLADDRSKCHKVFHPRSFRCCKSDLPQPEINKDDRDLAECFHLPPDPFSCEHDICIGKKLGYVSGDGIINKDALEKIIEEDFKSSSTLIEAIKENCIKADLSKVGPPDACELVKFKWCKDKTIIIECQDWDNTGSCTGLKDLVRECAKMDEDE